MKKYAKVLIVLVLIVFACLASGLGYVKFALPDVDEAPDLKVEITLDRLERGRYLANNVALCVDCHSTRDWSRFAAPLLDNKLGIGGEKFDESIGFPGAVYSANITPYNLAGWTDGELFRVITTGVNKDGKALINIMPYPAYGKMAKEDIYSIIAYIRSLPAQKSSMPERRLDFPLNFLVNTIPAQAMHSEIPSESDTIKYGGYLVNAAACVDCHTKQDKGKNIEGMEFAGSRDFRVPKGTVYSANLTSDKKTGIGNWTREQFIGRFKMYANAHEAPKVAPGDFQTIMPWYMYAGIKESDLSAMYIYLRTIKPISNQVTKFVPAK
jgi:mono/diheme cytochrome c family protein